MRRIGLALCVSGWLATAGCGLYGPPERHPPAAETPPAAVEEEVVPTRTLPEEDEFREDSEEHPAAVEPVR